jgi:hypothetical protein
MRITGLTLGVVGTVAVAGTVASLVIPQSNQAKLSERAGALSRQAGQIAQLTAENERLSNLVARAGTSQGLPPDQLGELLRLRGQIGRLRQAAKEHAQLQAANEQLRWTRARSEEQLAAARAAPNFWAKDQLAFAGYADPEAALKTLLWALRNADLKACLSSCDLGPEATAALQQFPREQVEAQMAAELKMMSESLAPSVGFHIMDKKVKSTDEAILKLSFDGEGKVRKFVMKRTGNEWKMADMLRPGEDEP